MVLDPGLRRGLAPEQFEFSGWFQELKDGKSLSCLQSRVPPLCLSKEWLGGALGFGGNVNQDLESWQFWCTSNLSTMKHPGKGQV